MLSTISAAVFALLAPSSTLDWNLAINAPDELTDAEKAKAQAILERTYSYSETCEETWAACLKESEKSARRVAGMVLRQVHKGRDDEKIEKMIMDRQVSLFPVKKKYAFSLNKDTRTSSEPAKLEIVEFADFQCPYCAAIAPELSKIVKEFNGTIAVTYQNFPLKDHERAVDAARAALAAAAQGKFWAYNERLYAMRHALSDADLVKYAKELGLDVERFNHDRSQNDTLERIRAEKRLGSQLGVVKTPTFFINGAQFYFIDLSPVELRDRLEEALELFVFSEQPAEK